MIHIILDIYHLLDSLFQIKFLKQKINIIYSDVDIVIKKNFYDEIKDMLNTNECVYQFNGTDCLLWFFLQ